MDKSFGWATSTKIPKQQRNTFIHPRNTHRFEFVYNHYTKSHISNIDSIHYSIISGTFISNHSNKYYIGIVIDEVIMFSLLTVVKIKDYLLLFRNLFKVSSLEELNLFKN